MADSNSPNTKAPIPISTKEEVDNYLKLVEEGIESFLIMSLPWIKGVKSISDVDFPEGIHSIMRDYCIKKYHEKGILHQETFDIEQVRLDALNFIKDRRMEIKDFEDFLGPNYILCYEEDTLTYDMIEKPKL